MSKKPFVNDEEVKFLLYQYKLGQKKNVLNKHQQNDVFINLYK